jgi:hypothetical protein
MGLAERGIPMTLDLRVILLMTQSMKYFKFLYNAVAVSTLGFIITSKDQFCMVALRKQQAPNRPSTHLCGARSMPEVVSFSR